MRTTWRVIVVTALALVLLADPASAGGGDDRSGGEGGSDNSVLNIYADGGYLTVEISDGSGSRTIVGPQLPEWLRKCNWHVTTRYDAAGMLAARVGGGEGIGSREEWIAAGWDPDEPWAIVFCRPGPEAQAIKPGIQLTGILEQWSLNGEPPQVILDWIVASAVAAVEIPLQVGQSAPFGDESAPLITQLPVWMWVDEGVWSPRSASNPAVFGTVATATATPYRIVFEGPDGQSVDCGANEGPAYDFGLAEEEQSSNCTLLYQHASSVGDFALSSTIYWQISWVCNQYCGTGTLDVEFVISNSRPVRVAELQAIGTSIGSE